MIAVSTTLSRIVSRQATKIAIALEASSGEAPDRESGGVGASPNWRSGMLKPLGWRQVRLVGLESVQIRTSSHFIKHEILHQ